MNKSIFGLASLILAFPAVSDETRINTTRDSGGYEASLRDAGVPISGGLAWTNHSRVPGVAEAPQLAATNAAPARTVVAKFAKVGKDS